MSSSSQKPAPVSTTRALADLAAVIDLSVSSEQAAELIEAFRSAVRAEAFREARDASDIHQLTEGGDGMTAIDPSLAARIAATGVPLSADYAPQPATPRWHQLRTELIRMLRPYMPETARTKAVDLVDEVITEALLEGARNSSPLNLTDEEAAR